MNQQISLLNLFVLHKKVEGWAQTTRRGKRGMFCRANCDISTPVFSIKLRQSVNRAQVSFNKYPKKNASILTPSNIYKTWMDNNADCLKWIETIIRNKLKSTLSANAFEVS